MAAHKHSPRLSTHPHLSEASLYAYARIRCQLGRLATTAEAIEGASPAEWQDKTVRDRLTVLLMDVLEVSEREIVPTASLVEDLGADSLNLVEIVFGIQEEFQVEMTSTDVEKLTTVGEIVDFLASKESQ